VSRQGIEQMARYRDIDMSARLLPVSLEAQIVPGSFAHAVYHLGASE